MLKVFLMELLSTKEKESINKDWIFFVQCLQFLCLLENFFFSFWTFSYLTKKEPSGKLMRLSWKIQEKRKRLWLYLFRQKCWSAKNPHSFNRWTLLPLVFVAVDAKKTYSIVYHSFDVKRFSQTFFNFLNNIFCSIRKKETRYRSD